MCVRVRACARVCACVCVHDDHMSNVIHSGISVVPTKSDDIKVAITVLLSLVRKYLDIRTSISKREKYYTGVKSILRIIDCF